MVVFSKSDLGILTVGFTSLLERSLQLEVVSWKGSQVLHSCKEHDWTRLQQRQVFLFFLCARCHGKKKPFYPAWKTSENVTSHDSEPLLSNAHHCRSHHMGLDNILHITINEFQQMIFLTSMFPAFLGHFICHGQTGWGFVEVLMGWLFSKPSNCVCVRLGIFDSLLGNLWNSPEGSSFSRYTGNYFFWCLFGDNDLIVAGIAFTTHRDSSRMKVHWLQERWHETGVHKICYLP